jgi:hypothetical protein
MINDKVSEEAREKNIEKIKKRMHIGDNMDFCDRYTC